MAASQRGRGRTAYAPVMQAYADWYRGQVNQQRMCEFELEIGGLVSSCAL